MRKRLFPLVVALSALLVAGSAAFYSVFGLSKLFAGASLQVIIMAGSLEFAKLVSASLLYQYWDTINKALKGYLIIAVFTLMLITSGGIYGYLSAAYQSTATQSELLDKSLAILNQKQIRFQETKEDLTIEKTQLNQTISDLRVSLSNPAQVSWYDKEAEKVITTTSSSARRALQAELKTTIEDRDVVNVKLEAILDSISTTDMALLNKEISNEAERELGPLKYLAETTGRDMSIVVNWFLLLIIFVFDPLAIALVVAANFAFAQIKRKDPDPEPEGSEPSDELKQRVKENQEKLKKEPFHEIPNIPFEEEKWIPEPEVKIVEKEVIKEVIKEVPVEVEKIVEVEKKEEPIHEGKQMAKGLDTFIEILEEEEQKEEGEQVDQSDEHEFYHGKDAENKQSNKPLSDNDKRRRIKKRVVKPRKGPRKSPKQYGYKG